jgi:hypothetical protein
MTPRLVAAALGGVGGLLLAVAGGLSFLAHEAAGWHGALAAVGYAAVVAALCVVGYGLVAQAPVWLRVIVSVAFPLLMASVWQVVDQALADGIDGWKASATTHLLGGVIALVAALVAIRRPAADRGSAYAPTHHR